MNCCIRRYCLQNSHKPPMEKCRRMKRPQCMSKTWTFFTMKVMEDTPAALSLGKLCDENGYSYEWINGQKPHLMKNGIRIQCNMEKFVPIVVLGLSTSSSLSLPSSTSMTPSMQEIDHPIFLKFVFLTTTHVIFNCVKRKCGQTRTGRPVRDRSLSLSSVK